MPNLDLLCKRLILYFIFAVAFGVVVTQKNIVLVLHMFSSEDWFFMLMLKSIRFMFFYHSFCPWLCGLIGIMLSSINGKCYQYMWCLCIIDFGFAKDKF